MFILSLNQTHVYSELQILLALFSFHGHNWILLMLPVLRNSNLTDPLNLRIMAPEPATPINTAFGFFAPF